MRTYTDEELMQRAWDVHEIKNLMGRHAYYHAYNLHEQELEELWVKEPEHQKTASFGQNWGYQVGMEQIRRNYVEYNAKFHQEDLDALCARRPEVENKPENLGAGTMVIHALTTPYIEIAGDGKTAQGLWYSPGQITTLGENGPEGAHIYERYGVDFIREADGWKIWHLFIGTDFILPAGADMTKQPVDQPAPDVAGEFELTYPMEAYTSRYNYAHYPDIPEPYETFDQTISNGPEGNPNFRKAGACK